ncbi:hypothetical protein [uncultured Erythrobacter sp.]|uniref:hypothetical protein n=1 Tax=uncultured Erythrobacter sp. TaxID=263913 RepID=UPI00260A3C98|nr:hypothetical protein [uncultured Erythrobacter sp.]
MNMFLKSAAIAAGTLAVLAAPVSAQDTAQEVSVAFTYDANASTEQNYRELRGEVRRACRSGNAVVSSVFGRKARSECRESLLTKAVAATGRPALIAMHGKPVSQSRAAIAAR